MRKGVGCSASNQRVGCGGGGGGAAGGGAALGSGNGEPAAGAAAALGFFGFFGRITVRAAFGGGPAGLSSANTGLGSTVVEAGVEKSPGLRITCTVTVAGWNRGRLKVTEKPLSGAGTETWQGVLQPGPSEVTASAPGGTDSSWTWIGGGVGLRESSENEEHPARLIPVTAIAMTRRMINHSTAANSHNPHADHKSVRTGVQPQPAYSLKDG
jgi:hypothetical protein